MYYNGSAVGWRFIKDWIFFSEIQRVSGWKLSKFTHRELLYGSVNIVKFLKNS